MEEANLDLRVHVIAIEGAGKIFCGGYDLKDSAEFLTSDDDANAKGVAADDSSSNVGKNSRHIVTSGVNQATNHIRTLCLFPLRVWSSLNRMVVQPPRPGIPPSITR